MDYGKIALKRLEDVIRSINVIKGSASPQSGDEIFTLSRTEAVGSYEYTARLKTVARGKLQIDLSVNLSCAVDCTVSLDGDVVSTMSLYEGNNQAIIQCTDVPPAIHEVTVVFTAEEFTLYKMMMSVEGFVAQADGDVFIQGFSDGAGYVKLRFGTLEVYRDEDGEFLRICEIQGVKYVRTAVASGVYRLFIITEKGHLIMLSSLLDGDDFDECFICDGATSACGTPSNDGQIFIVASREDGLYLYKYLSEVNAVEFLCRQEGSADEITSVLHGNRMLIVWTNKSSVSFSKTHSFSLPCSDTFNFDFRGE